MSSGCRQGHSIIALASATGEKTSAPLPEPKYNAPLARAKEGPKAETTAPSEKSFRQKLKTDCSAIIVVAGGSAFRHSNLIC